MQLLPNNLKSSFEQEAIKLGLLGSTLLAATGDDGVTESRGCNFSLPFNNFNCACNFSSSETNTSNSQTGNTWTGFGYFPNFPATCPYVTAVGGTFKTGVNEIAASTDAGATITTGGGFSTYYARADWQSAAVASYFKQVSSGATRTPASGFNPLGRGIPDVSANSNDFGVVINGFLTSQSGTSASTPVFSAMRKYLFT